MRPDAAPVATPNSAALAEPFRRRPSSTNPAINATVAVAEMIHTVTPVEYGSPPRGSSMDSNSTTPTVIVAMAVHP
jgi:hypothetical protein